MSTLLVDELYPGVVFRQPVRINKSVNIAHIRPWVYKNNDLLDGELEVRVYQGTTLLATSSLAAADINAGFTENYAHGFLKLDFPSLELNVPEQETTQEYIIEYEMINHTLNVNNYIGIVRRWEAKTYPTYGNNVVNNEAPNDAVEPSGLELFEYKET